MLQVKHQRIKPMKKLSPRFKLWFNTKNTDGVFGDGKWRLLKAIDSTGSLTAASNLLGISYRKAWGDLKKAEKHLGVSLIQKQRGGKAGGKTSLTKEGKKWVTAYTKFRSDIKKTVDKSQKKYFNDHIEAVAAIMACKSRSIKAHQRLNEEEMLSIIRQLSRCQNPEHCCHGRPTMITLSINELEKKFLRK